MIVGVVDIGTNTVRLLVADGEATLERTATITRLGAGVDHNRRLDTDAVARTLACLRDLAARLGAHGAERVRAVATSVLRDATDREAFLSAASEVLGVRVEVLPGEEEARLGFLGATRGLDPASGPFLVLDIGGGSTEVSYGVHEPEHAASMDVGAVRLTEAVLHHDPPQPEELVNAIGLAEDHLEDVLLAAPQLTDAGTIIGVAGTIVTIAAVELGYYDRDAIHHFVLTREAVEEVFRTLATEPLADRLHNPGLQPGRADIIVGGACVLVAVLRKLKARQLLVSETDLLDGLAQALAG